MSSSSFAPSGSAGGHRLWPPVAVLLLGLAAACGRPVPPPATAGAGGAPDRICSLTLVSDEILAELVPPERVVGVTYLADDAGYSNVAGVYPRAVKRVRPTLEDVLPLTPDLICVAPYVSPSFLETLSGSDRAVLAMPATDSMAGIGAAIRSLAAAVDEVDRGRDLVARFEARLDRVRRAVGEARRPSVLAWTGGFVYARGSSVDALIRAAGGRNAIEGLELHGCVQIPEETVLSLDPDWILLEGVAADPGAGLPAIYSGLRAVREKRVLHLAARHFSTVSHHVVAGVEVLARALHPDAFADDGR